MFIVNKKDQAFEREVARFLKTGRFKCRLEVISSKDPQNIFSGHKRTENFGFLNWFIWLQTMVI